MDVNGEQLTFSHKECYTLATIFTYYLNDRKDTLSPTALAIVYAGWHIASNVMFADGLDAASLNAINDSLHKTTGTNPGYKIIPEGPVEISNESGAVTAAIHWAAQYLTAGGLVHQNEVGVALNSGYEDMGMSPALGSTNESYARRIGQRLVEAGQVAVLWSQQLPQ